MRQNADATDAGCPRTRSSVANWSKRSPWRSLSRCVTRRGHIKAAAILHDMTANMLQLRRNREAMHSGAPQGTAPDGITQAELLPKAQSAIMSERDDGSP